MNTIAPTVAISEKEPLEVFQKPSSLPFWKMFFLVTINFFTVALAIPIVYFPTTFSQELWTELWFMLVGLYHGQLFLVAYWKSFGGTRWMGRWVLLSLLTICGAAPVAAMFAHRAFIFFHGNRPIQVGDFGPIILSLIVVWSLHVIFLIATCASPIEINFREARRARPTSRQGFTLLDAIRLIVLALIPIGLIFLLYSLDHVFAGKMVPAVAISVLFTGIALTPAALLFVTESNFLWKFIGASAWAAVTVVIFLFLPEQWASERTATAHLAAVGIVFFNLLVLRAMGLRWIVPPDSSPATTDKSQIAI
jgi:hypothetical protein